MGERVVVVPPMGRAYSTIVDSVGLETLSGVVKGDVDLVPFEPGRPSDEGRALDVWCNDEGLLRDDLPFNRAVLYPDGEVVPIYGPMVISAARLSDGESVGLTFDEALSVLTGPLSYAQVLSAPDGHACFVESFRDSSSGNMRALLALATEHELAMMRLTDDDVTDLGRAHGRLVGEPEAMALEGFLARIDRTSPAGAPPVVELSCVESAPGLEDTPFLRTPAPDFAAGTYIDGGLSGIEPWVAGGLREFVHDALDAGQERAGDLSRQLLDASQPRDPRSAARERDEGTWR